MIPYVDLAAQNVALKEDILAAVARVLDHGWFILGPEVKELEARLAERLGVRHVIGVANGTDALTLALRARGIERDDEVITVSHSFVATASSIALIGARPVFVDVDEATMLIDPDRLEAARTEKTRAVMPVHLNGHPCDMDALVAFCEKHGLELIEDCAQAIGTTWQDSHGNRRSVGSFGTGCFSLHPLKALSACGDAGFIATSDDATAGKLRQLRNLGLIDRDHCGDVAPNSRLDTLHAAILLVKLEALDEGLARRRAHAAAYREALAGSVVLPPEAGENDVTWSAFVIRHPRRDELMEQMRQRGVDVKAHYPLAIHQQPAFAHHEVDLPVTEKVVAEILSLPVTAELSDLDRDRVIEALLQSLEAL